MILVKCPNRRAPSASVGSGLGIMDKTKKEGICKDAFFRSSDPQQDLYLFRCSARQYWLEAG